MVQANNTKLWIGIAQEVCYIFQLPFQKPRYQGQAFVGLLHNQNSKEPPKIQIICTLNDFDRYWNITKIHTKQATLVPINKRESITIKNGLFIFEFSEEINYKKT